MKFGMRLAHDVSSVPAKFRVDRITTGEMAENRKKVRPLSTRVDTSSQLE